MQTRFWGRFKRLTGWRAYACAVGGEPDGTGEVFALVRPLGAGYSFAYLPHGPAEPIGCADPCAYLTSLAAAIAAGIGGRLLFLRFDLTWDRDGAAGRALAEALGRHDCLLRRGSAVQVPDTVILDLRRPEEELLAAMKPKWRYNIRLAEKKGVEVAREGAEALEIFYALYLETAKRDGIAIHPLSYYRRLFDTPRDLPAGAAPLATAESSATDGPSANSGSSVTDLSVWVARHEGKPIAAIITLFHGGRATYLYGASSGEKRNLMPAYALQWKAIEAAKAAGCADYDFFGIPPDDSPDHPMAGLYLFKTGFGGDIVHRVGSVDYPLAPLAYGFFRAAEKMRLVWFKKIKKMLKGGAGRAS
ncbi:peptidoglycan bridge formation glycyltransferase FemA/FemB family protein [bacterium]|nr:peptidoglycan bridge formation glycyltransferase FemA/FemB family protein [bacterium]